MTTTPEQIEAAKIVSIYSSIKDRSEARKKIAAFLALRDQEVSARATKPWREAVEGHKYEWGCFCAKDHSKEDPGDKFCLMLLALLSSPAAPEPSRPDNESKEE